MPDPMYEMRVMADLRRIKALAAKPTAGNGRPKTTAEERQRTKQKTGEKSSPFYSRFWAWPIG